MQNPKVNTYGTNKAFSMLLSLVLAALMVCAALLPGFAVTERKATVEPLTAKERATQSLVGDSLSANKNLVAFLKQNSAYADFLDALAKAQKSHVGVVKAQTGDTLETQGLNLSLTVADLQRLSKVTANTASATDLLNTLGLDLSNQESILSAARDVFGQVKAWLLGEEESTSVLPYADFQSLSDIADFTLKQLVEWNALQDFVDTVVPAELRDAVRDLAKQLGLVSETPAWDLLDANAIVSYARKYAKNYNPDYRVPESGSDCTNFVSQCLYTGGLSMSPSSIRGTNPGTLETTSEWYYYNSPSASENTPYEKAVAVSTSWVRVEDLYTYLAPHYNTIESQNKDTVTEHFKEGRVIQGASLLGRYEHSSIITMKNDKWCYCAHTNDRKDRNMVHYFNAYERFRVIEVC